MTLVYDTIVALQNKHWLLIYIGVNAFFLFYFVWFVCLWTRVTKRILLYVWKAVSCKIVVGPIYA